MALSGHWRCLLLSPHFLVTAGVLSLLGSRHLTSVTAGGGMDGATRWRSKGDEGGGKECGGGEGVLDLSPEALLFR
jgi:hypothetical protein